MGMTKNAPRLASAVAAALCMAVSGCASDGASGNPGNAESASSSPGDANGEPKKIAYLTASSALSFLVSAREAIEEVASANNAEVTEFDAQFDPATQRTQLQDVVASGQYDGIIMNAIDGPGVIPGLESAIEAGIEVALLNQVVGTDLDTAEPQFPGVAVSVLAPPTRSGRRLGELTKRACQDVDPCNVVYFYGIKGVPLDTALRDGFDESTASASNIDIVAEAEGKYLGPEESLKAMQDILQKERDIDVVVGADMSIQGSLLALEDAGLADQVKLIGFGGSETAIKGIQDGTWFAGLFVAPRTEGKLAAEGLIEAMNNGTKTGGIDTASELPDEGLVTADNVAKFDPQWSG